MRAKHQGQLFRSSGLLIASAFAYQGAATAADSDNTTSEVPVLQEVVVTAQKREERAQDVPMGLTVLDTSSLVEQNATRIQDYAKSVPGLSLTEQDQGTQLLVIRGITTGRGTNPTVGVTIDDVPVGSTVAVGDGDINTLDLDPSDLQSIQVMKGPQGTLYGAASMGGLLKYVSITPSLSKMSGSFEADTSTVHNGDVGYGFRGEVSLPLIPDTLAVSIAGHARRDPGYIDIPAQGRSAVNQTQYDGGHLTVLWHPLDNLSIKLGALAQTNSGNGSSYYDTDFYSTPTHGDLQQTTLPGTGHFYNRNELFSANISLNLGWGNLTSTSGYAKSAYDANQNFPGGASGLIEFLGFPENTGSFLENQYTMAKATEELRLASEGTGPFEWLVGAFYTHEDNQSGQMMFAADANTGAVQSNVGVSNFPLLYSEYAGFADLTYHITTAWKVQVGARYAKNFQHYTETDGGLYFGEYYVNTGSVDHKITHLVTTSYDFSSSLTAYARIASGYRPGGPNSAIAAAPVAGVPFTYQPDTTENYELGLKGSGWDRRFEFDVDVFYIDWKDIQLGESTPTYEEYLTNAGAARTQGLEASALVRPFEHFKVYGNIALTDATLRKAFPAGANSYGVCGDRLPFVPKETALIGLEQEIPIQGNWNGFAGGDVSYTGARLASFRGYYDDGVTPVPRSVMPAYTTVDLHAGARSDLWAINLFVNNLADRRGILSSDLVGGEGGPGSPYQVIAITPRTIGLSIRRQF